MTYFDVVRSLAVSESNVLRAYCRAGKVLIPHGAPLLEQALVIVSDRRKLAEFERHLLPRATAPANAEVA